MAEKMGRELMDEVGEDVTLDSFFDGDPRTKDIQALIRVLRRDRAMFIKGKGAGRAKDKPETEESEDAEA